MIQIIRMLMKRGAVYRLSMAAVIGADTFASLILAAVLPARAATWVPATGNLANMASECGNLCHVFPVPNSYKVIAGVAGAGLWVTGNGGATWTKLGGADSIIRNRPQQILYDPVNAGIFWEVGIYTAPGIVKTIDDGRTFNPVGGISHNDSLGIDFTDPRRLIMIATGHETNRKFYKSTNGGVSFAEIGGNFPEDANMTSACLLIDSRTYVVACYGWGKPGAIWRTADGGMNWTRVSDQTATAGGSVLRTTKGLLFCGSQNGNRLLKGSNDGASWSSIAAPGARRVSPIELPGGAIATLGKDGIMISADDGATWKTVAPGLPIPPGGGITVGGLAYNAVAGAAYVWFWDCGNVVRPDAIWRCDILLPPSPAN
jgi:hypothetical protein